MPRPDPLGPRAAGLRLQRADALAADPADVGARSVAAQDKDATSPRALYRAALGVRRKSDALHSGSLTWRDAPAGALVFVREHHSDAIVCAVNVSADELPMPSGEVLLTSEPRLRDRLPANAAAWVRLPRR